MRVALGAASLAFLCCAAVASAGSSAAAAPTAGVPEMTSRQRANRLKDLPSEERTWLTQYVAPIILPPERDLFLQLSTDYQREMFKREFWKRRERVGLLPPLGPGYEGRYANLREVAAESYDGVDSDAGRMVVRMGEPPGVQILAECSEVFRQAEIWSYPAGVSGSNIRHLFYRPSFGAPRRLWTSGDRGIFQTASCITTFEQACESTMRPPPGSGEDFCPQTTVPRGCTEACTAAAVGAEIQARGASEASVLSQSPAVSLEGLEALWERLASVSDSRAAQLPIGPGTAAPPAVTEKSSADEVPWSAERIRDAIEALPKKYREWLDLAKPLLSGDELLEFLRLPSGQRDAYVRRFWKKHAHSR